MKEDACDVVVVVGGGATGLSAALVLGRARRRVAVIDAGAPRNAPDAHMHGFLSRDGMPPADLLAEGRDDALATMSVPQPWKWDGPPGCRVWPSGLRVSAEKYGTSG